MVVLPVADSGGTVSTKPNRCIAGFTFRYAPWLVTWFCTESPIASNTPLRPQIADDPFRTATRRERIESVRAALDDLPAPWRAILFLRDGLGLSYAEIARIEQRTEDVVRVTLHRARKRLRARLQTTSKEGTER